MINRKEDMVNFLDTAIFMVLVLLLVSFFYAEMTKRNDQPFQNNFMSMTVNSSQNAVTVDVIQLPLYDKSWVSLFDKSNFTFFNEGLKIFADNKEITLRINTILKTQLQIKPPNPCRFYRHLFPIDSDALPNLS
jgi:hypothetical protein